MSNNPKMEDVVLYWAKSLENKPLSQHELVEEANWLIDSYKKVSE